MLEIKAQVLITLIAPFLPLFAVAILGVAFRTCPTLARRRMAAPAGTALHPAGRVARKVQTR